MDAKDVILWIIIVVALIILLLYFLARLFPPKPTSPTSPWGIPGEGGEDEDYGPTPGTSEEKEIQRQKARRMSALIKRDAELGQQLNRLGGTDVGKILSTSTTSEEALAVARRIPNEFLETLEVAASQKDINLDLSSKTSRTPVQHPTNDMEPEQMMDFAQLPDVAPEQLAMMTPGQFYQAAAEGNLTVMQSYESETVRKRAYILLDISRSMQELMGRGTQRHIWSRGVAVNMLRRARTGDAEYFIRRFSGSPDRLMKASSASEASALIAEILDTGLSDSGTDIGAALKQAANDIRRQNSNIKATDILLISDGQDNGGLTAEQLKRILGKDIRLHVASIGIENPMLRDAATTYRVFD